MTPLEGSSEHAGGRDLGDLVLLVTRSDQIAEALRAVLQAAGHLVAEPLPGVLSGQTTDPVALFAAARTAVSNTEADDVRALVVRGQRGADLLAAALDAPTLTEVLGIAERARAADDGWLMLPGNDWSSDADQIIQVGQPGPESALHGPADIDALMTRAVLLANAAVTIADARSPDLPLIYVNDAFERLSGYRARDVIGQNCRFLQSPGTDPVVLQHVRDAIAAGRDFTGVLRNRRKNGELWWNELRMSAVHDAAGHLTHYFGFQNDVTAQIVAEAHVKYLGKNDHLTGLPDRSHIVSELERALIRARTEGTRVAVLVVELSGFQEINDRIGAGGGDLALLATIMRLRGALRPGDLVGRQDGDTFLAVMPGVPPHELRTITGRAADAIRGSFTKPLDIADATISLSATVGLATFPEHGNTAQELVRAAAMGLTVGPDAALRRPS